MVKIKDGIKVGLHNVNFNLPEEIVEKIDKITQERKCARSVVLRDIVCKELGVPNDTRLRRNGNGKHIIRTTRMLNDKIDKCLSETVDGARTTVLQNSIMRHFGM